MMPTSQPFDTAHPRRNARTVAGVLRLLPSVALYVLLALSIALILVPFLWMLSNAFKDQTALYASPPI